MIKSYDVKYKYNSICLMSSAGCNLNCKYCEIAKSKDSSSYSADLQKQIKQAFEDGSFLRNVAITYKKLNQNFEDITCINFWGQEPTLTFDSFRSRLEEWFDVFPNINHIFFSTNGGTDPMILYNLIVDVDKAIDHDIKIDIQVSYDGNWSCLNQRLIDPEIIKQNHKILIEKINNTLLKHTSVHFTWHGVLNFELMYYLLDNNKIEDYLIDLDNIAHWSNELSTNPKCSTTPTTLSLEQPYKASTMDGLMLSQFIDISLRTNFKHKFYFENAINTVLRQLVGGINDHQKIFFEDRWIQTLLKTIDGQRDNYGNSLFDGVFCGSYRTELKIMHDGTIAGCQNFLFSTKKEHLNEDNPVIKSVKENLIDKGMFVNLTNENTTKEDLDKVFKKFENNETSFLATFQSILNTILFLADIGQASQEYLYNREKLFKHGIMIAKYNSCFFNHVITTGSAFLEPIRVCRLLCNGALDYAEKWYHSQKISQQKERIC